MDTIAAYTIVCLDIKFFLNYEWVRKSPTSKDAGPYWEKQLYNLIFRYYILHHQLRVEFSIPHFLYGYNAILFNFQHKKKLIKLVNLCIKEILPYAKIESFADWIVTRADFPFHIMVPSNDLKTYMLLLSKLRIPYCTNREYKTGNSKGNKRHRTSTYEKAAEIEHRDAKSLAKVRNKVKNIDGVIRIEEQLFSKKLAAYFGNRRRVKDILNEKTARFVIETTFKKMGLNYNFLSQAEMAVYIANTHPNSLKLQSFVTAINTGDWKAVREVYSHSTCYYYIKLLHDDNISPYYLCQKVKQKVNFRLIQYTSHHFTIRRQLRRFLRTSEPATSRNECVSVSQVNKSACYMRRNREPKIIALHCRSPTL